MLSNSRRKGKFLATAGMAIAAGLAAQPASCPAPSGTVLQEVADAVATRFDLAPDLAIEDEGPVNETCYRRLTLRSRAPNRILALYLSPDQRFVTPDLIDLALSAPGERMREAAETAKLLEVDPSPARGPATSDVTIVEFSDFECPYCKQLAQYLSRARKEGAQFRVIFKQMPLPQHPWAREAAVLTSCVAAQSNDAFWLVHDYLFEGQEALSASTLKSRINTLVSERSDIDSSVFEKCANGDKPNQVLQADERLASEFHVSQTPTIFINGSRKVGLMPFDDLIASVNAARRQSVNDASFETRPAVK